MGSSPTTGTMSEQASYRLLRLFFKSQSALTLRLLLSKTGPAVLGSGLVLGANPKAEVLKVGTYSTRKSSVFWISGSRVFSCFRPVLSCQRGYEAVFGDWSGCRAEWEGRYSASQRTGFSTPYPGRHQSSRWRGCCCDQATPEFLSWKHHSSEEAGHR